MDALPDDYARELPLIAAGWDMAIARRQADAASKGSGGGTPGKRLYGGQGMAG